MASSLKNLSENAEISLQNPSAIHLGIVVSSYNETITNALYEGCHQTLTQHGILPENIYTLIVPGAFELTAGARMLSQSKNVDAVICLGCVIKGDTSHNEYINQAVAHGLTNLGIATGKAFIFGLLTPNTYEQALERAGGKHGNKGVEAANAALHMVNAKLQLSDVKKKIGFGNP